MICFYYCIFFGVDLIVAKNRQVVDHSRFMLFLEKTFYLNTYLIRFKFFILVCVCIVPKEITYQSSVMAQSDESNLRGIHSVCPSHIGDRLTPGLNEATNFKCC